MCMQKDGMNMFSFNIKKRMDYAVSLPWQKHIKCQNEQTQQEIVKLECVFDYNQNMEETDIKESLMIYYPAFRKTIK